MIVMKPRLPFPFLILTGRLKAPVPWREKVKPDEGSCYVPIRIKRLKQRF